MRYKRSVLTKAGKRPIQIAYSFRHSTKHSQIQIHPQNLLKMQV